MIQPFVDRFMSAKPAMIQDLLASEHPSYGDLVKRLIVSLRDPDGYGNPDPDRITEIDHGHYQGTLVYIVAEDGYQPSTYWATTVNYGSCSGCDTLQAIQGYSSDPMTPEQANDYWTLMLHVVQRMHRIGE